MKIQGHVGPIYIHTLYSIYASYRQFPTLIFNSLIHRYKIPLTFLVQTSDISFRGLVEL